MKTILVPTDFSTASEHAVQYAATLAEKCNALVRLLHVYQMPVPTNDFPVMIVSADELKRVADDGLSKARKEAEQLFPNVKFETESRLGDVVAEINGAGKSEEVMAVVTGTKDLGGFERFLTGDTTLSIIRNCEHPLIAVPEGAEQKLPSKMALAADSSKIDNSVAQKVIEFAQFFGAELQIVHVENDRSEIAEDSLPLILKGANYQAVKEDDVAQGLQQFAASQNIDMMVVLPHKHSFLEKLFSKEHTDDIIHAVKIPLLCVK